MTDAFPFGGVELRVGGATDVGQLRSVNQDALILGAAVFGVADGMGGHRGGEVASALAAQTVEGAFDQLTPDDTPPTVAEFCSVVDAANDAVLDRSTKDPALAGMGTTLVALAVVAQPEVRLGIVNVGDSRAYRFADGALRQVTEDHSLVAELVREGRITEAEAESHPQKNIVTRALGIEPGIGVDDFLVVPRTGERYLLCSDGLTNEVPDAEIARVLTTVADPDDAAHRLVDMANASGGRDNITVVIVDVVDDGGAAAVADEAGVVPDAPDFSAHTDADTQSYSPITVHAPPPVALDPDAADTTRKGRRARRRAEAATSHPVHGTPDRGSDGRASDDLTSNSPAPDAPPSGGSARARLLTWRSVAFVAVVVALLGTVYFMVDRYQNDTYFLGADGDDVVIYRGPTQSFLWISPRILDADTDLALEDLGDRDRIAVEDRTLTYTSETEVRTKLEDLRDTTTTTPSTTPPSETTTSTLPDLGATTTTPGSATPAGSATTTTRP